MLLYINKARDKFHISSACFFFWLRFSSEIFSSGKTQDFGYFCYIIASYAPGREFGSNIFNIAYVPKHLENSPPVTSKAIDGYEKVLKKIRCLVS